MTNMSIAIEATWFDLDEAGAAEHLEWEHTGLLPGLSQQPGVLWAASYRAITSNTNASSPSVVTFTDDPTVPTGTSYLALVGAAESSVFVESSWTDRFVAGGAEAPAHLAERHGTRRNVFVEESAIDGPEPMSFSRLPAPCIQLGSFNTREWTDQDELAAFYANLRMPTLTHTRGCVRASKLVSVLGWAKHAIFYEFASPEARRDTFEADVEVGAHPQFLTERGRDLVWGGRHPTEYLIFAPGSPTVAERMWPKL